MKGQPGDRAIAPGRLALVQSFVNSINVEFGPDYLATVEGFATWLDRHGFPGLEPGELDRRDAVTFREALRALLREHNGGDPDLPARGAVEHIARGCPLVVDFDESGALRLGPTLSDVRGVFATILAAVSEAAIEGSWQRLKACHAHQCEWAFYDRSRNRTGRWCSMEVCGTRSKMRVYRESKKHA
ncbi:CGNR zinc finger domain-containing protein [Nonomuraea sp. K274]|uniref:CGNR zinc finger domain-containing protein n=1 Tax=Nonomuraea cypriaca TaxID=1187855 RepID=A0A931A5K9_9ACTN|nr:CGNR zinc finger domain-containing protein [Nonomuraea cypriaca]MBF8184473.1 CGNR zinc finger domain-containing protein [Nonomuraea cypriaca]